MQTYIFLLLSLGRETNSKFPHEQKDKIDRTNLRSKDIDIIALVRTRALVKTHLGFIRTKMEILKTHAG